MAFSDFCENSKKLNRIIVVSTGLLITGLLLCMPLFRELTDNQLAALEVSRNVWFPIFSFIIGWLFKSEPVDKK